MATIKAFFAGVLSVLLALLALLFLRPRKKSLTKEAQEAVDKLEDIETREKINAKFHDMSAHDVVTDYLEREEQRRKDSGSK